MFRPNRSFCVLVALTLWCGAAAGGERIKIGVLGDSISKNRIAMGGKGWPLYLGKLLGDGYQVETFSANGVDCLRVPSISIWQKGELPKLIAFEPNIAIIMLGANTARAGVSQYSSRYGSDYRATIDRLRAIKSKPKVYCCTPIPVYKENFGIKPELLHGVFEPIIRKTAEEAKAPLIDCYTTLIDQKHITDDGVHPTVKGMQAIAIVVYKALLEKDPPAERVAELAKEYAEDEAKRVAGENAQVAAAKAEEAQVMDVLSERAKTAPKVVELTPEAVRDVQGDGPDRKGNTADDSWGFWFELVHAGNTFQRLDLATQTMSADQRQNGIVDLKAKRGQKKVQGPIASKLPNPKDSEGWIFHSDWNGCFEGAWGDVKGKQVILYPYVEKNSHGAVAVTYLAPATGKYKVSGKVTDLQVQPEYAQHDGVTWKLEVAPHDGGKGVEIARGGPIGDGKGRPDSGEIKAEPAAVRQGQDIRLVIHPNKWWGSDMTKVELKIERLE
ncbi:MAG: GDSL-type esterase/lipase family protein [Planctomycetaceae bacterium]|nr:GDSL-type esterase/lipase family protein [Planctomycetaceae bacterium]